MARQRSARGMLASLLEKPTLNIKEPWYSKRIGQLAEGAKGVISNIKDRKKEEATEYAQELLTQQRFQSRLNVPIQNAFSDRTIYNNKTINELEAQIERMYNQDIKRFPKQAAELEDIYQSQKNQLKQYRSLNDQYSIGREKIQPAKDFIMKITNKLADFGWKELTPDKRMDFENRLYEGTQDIATLGRMIANNKEYFANHESFNIDADDIQIGIIGGYNQLLTQLDTIDPDGNIINKRELGMMAKAVRDNRPEEIIQRNERIVGNKIARITDKGKEFDKAHATWKQLSAYKLDPTYEKELGQKIEDYNVWKEELSNKLNRGDIEQSEFDIQVQDYLGDPEKWRSYVIMGEDKLGLNVLTIPTQITTLQDQMDRIDIDYKQDTGGEYSKWRGRATTWRLTEEDIELEKKKRLKADVAGLETKTEEGLPFREFPVSGRYVTPADVEEPLVVSKLHKPVVPEEPTMPTGIPSKVKKEKEITYDPAIGDTIHARNKARVKKYKISLPQLGELQDSWEDAGSVGTFDDYLDTALKKADVPDVKPISKDAQTVVEAHREVDKTGFSRSKEGVKFKEKYDLTNRQMSLLSALGNAYRSPDSPNKEARIARHEKAFAKSYNPLGVPGLSLKQSTTFYYNLYMTDDTNIALTDKVKRELEKQFSTIKYEKRVFQRMHPKKKDQTMMNLNAWRKSKKQK